MSLYLPGGAPSLDAPRHYPGSAPIPTRSTDILAPSWTGKTTVTGTPSPDSPATLTGVPFAATATGPDGQTRSVDLGFMGYSLPDGTKDTYDGVTGAVVQRVSLAILTGNSNISYSNRENKNTLWFAVMGLITQSRTNIISTHFKNRETWSSDVEGIWGGRASAPFEISFTLLKTRLANYGFLESDPSTYITAAKSWLAAQAAAGTPVTVYYALAQPVAYNRKADLKAFDGQTTVTGATTVEVIEGRIDRLAGYAYYEIVRSNPNLGINCDTRALINQRGQTTYTGSMYSVDMLYLARGELKIREKDMTLRWLNSGVDGYIQKPFENYDSFLGKQMVFSALIDGQVMSVKGILSDKYDFNSEIVDGVSLRIRHGAKAFAIFVSDTKEHVIGPMKIEEGPTQTLARKVGSQWVLNDPPPDTTLELLKCQRYQLNILDPLITGQSYIFKGKASEPSRFYGVLPTPVPMRTTPRVITDCSESTPYTAFGIVSSGYSQKIQITEIGAYSKMQNGVVLFATGSDIVRGNDYQVYIEKTNTHQFLLDANL